jgi:hypothetical protein
MLLHLRIIKDEKTAFLRVVWLLSDGLNGFLANLVQPWQSHRCACSFDPSRCHSRGVSFGFMERLYPDPVHANHRLSFLLK